MLRVFYGPMFSGKTNSLLTAVGVERVNYAKKIVLKSVLDTREIPGSGIVTANDRKEDVFLRSRTGMSLRVDYVISTLSSLLIPREKTLYVIDEIQFLEKSELLDFSSRVVNSGSALFAAGLDLDFRRKEFGATLELSRFAESLHGKDAVKVLEAKCCYPGCGAPASYTQRLSAGGKDVVVVGGEEFYRPACAAHHTPTPLTVTGEGWATGY